MKLFRVVAVTNRGTTKAYVIRALTSAQAESQGKAKFDRENPNLIATHMHSIEISERRLA